MIIYPFKIAENGILTHTRGDTAQFELQVQENGVDVPSWTAKFSVKHYPDDTDYVYQVSFDQSTPCVILNSYTQNIPFGTYWYDVQIIYESNGMTQYRTIGAYPYILRPDVTG